MAETSNISGEIKRRRWNCIGNILRKDPADDFAVALGWTPAKRERPKTTWRRIVEVERDKAGWNAWNTARREASDRDM